MQTRLDSTFEVSFPNPMIVDARDYLYIVIFIFVGEGVIICLELL